MASQKSQENSRKKAKYFYDLIPMDLTYPESDPSFFSNSEHHSYSMVDEFFQQPQVEAEPVYDDVPLSNQPEGEDGSDPDVASPHKPKGRGLNWRKRLEALQSHRQKSGTWVECKWRQCPQIQDPLEVPKFWTCAMGPDGSCDAPNEPYNNQKDYTLMTKFSAGSLVLAREKGYPWWPAIVDDDPDYNLYFWTKNWHKSCIEPDQFHVVYIDKPGIAPTRGWLKKSAVKPFKEISPKPAKNAEVSPTLRSRLTKALEIAAEARELDVEQRLKEFGYLAKFGGIRPDTQFASQVLSDEDSEEMPYTIEEWP